MAIITHNDVTTVRKTVFNNTHSVYASRADSVGIPKMGSAAAAAVFSERHRRRLIQDFHSARVCDEDIVVRTTTIERLLRRPVIHHRPRVNWFTEKTIFIYIYLYYYTS